MTFTQSRAHFGRHALVSRLECREDLAEFGRDRRGVPQFLLARCRLQLAEEPVDALRRFGFEAADHAVANVGHGECVALHRIVVAGACVQQELRCPKVEAGKVDLEDTSFDLGDCIAGAMKTMALKAEEKRLELLCDVAVGVPEVVRGDPGRLRQVLLNLLGNALKFTAEGEAERQRLTLKVENVVVDDLIESLTRLYHLRSERRGDQITFRSR